MVIFRNTWENWISYGLIFVATVCEILNEVIRKNDFHLLTFSDLALGQVHSKYKRLLPGLCPTIL